MATPALTEMHYTPYKSTKFITLQWLVEHLSWFQYNLLEVDVLYSIFSQWKIELALWLACNFHWCSSFFKRKVRFSLFLSYLCKELSHTEITEVFNAFLYWPRGSVYEKGDFDFVILFVTTWRRGTRLKDKHAVRLSREEVHWIIYSLGKLYAWKDNAVFLRCAGVPGMSICCTSW